MLTKRRIGSFFAVLWFLSAGASASAQTVVDAAWSQIMGQTERLEPGVPTPLNVRMRFVLNEKSDLTCEDFTISLKGQTVLLTKWFTRKVFEVKNTIVCDAPMSEDWPEAGLVLSDGTPAKVSIATQQGATELIDVTFSGPSAIGRRQFAQNRGDGLEIAVLGNTGCLGEYNSLGKQDCADPNDWPFARIAMQIGGSTALPDLVLHLGNARMDRANDNSWELWNSEFFAPAQALLLGVPWALTRGSQEDCGSQNAGAGWLLFFGPVMQEQNLDVCKRGRAVVPVHFFDVAVRSLSENEAAHRFVLVDTGPNPDRNLSKNFGEAFAYAQQHGGAGVASASIVTHRPIWGLDTFSGLMQQQSDPEVLAAFERTVQALEQGPCKPYSSKDCALKSILSSHQQAIENVTFPAKSGDPGVWDLPGQIVVGTSGTKPNKPEPNAAFTFENAGMSGGRGGQNCGKVANWSNDFGYLAMWRSAETVTQTQSGWVGELRFLGETETSPEFDKTTLGNGFSEDASTANCEW